MIKWCIGVDEAGRGPLAGPVAVGAVCVPVDFAWEEFPLVKDSKVMTEKARERVAAEAEAASEAGRLTYHVALIGADIINQRGIVASVKCGISECFDALNSDPGSTEVKLDGLLRAPEAFIHQETIIRGDATERSISLASVLAKVTRDRYMVALHERFPVYGFAQHKGYGTAMHLRALKEHGLSEEHRTGFVHI